MTRADLKKMIRKYHRSVIRPEMIDNPILRRSLRISESTSMRYEQDKRALYADKKLSDEQRQRGFEKAHKRFMAVSDRLRELDRQYERKYILPIYKKNMARKNAPARRVRMTF